MSRRISRALRAASLFASLLGACDPPPRTIDLCPRQRARELSTALAGGRFQIALERPGDPPLSLQLPADGPQRAFADLPAAATAVEVWGITAGGAIAAHGAAPLGDGATCVCLGAAAGDCAGLACRVTAGACAFVDGTGKPAGPLP